MPRTGRIPTCGTRMQTRGHGVGRREWRSTLSGNRDQWVRERLVLAQRRPRSRRSRSARSDHRSLREQQAGFPKSLRTLRGDSRPLQTKEGVAWLLVHARGAGTSDGSPDRTVAMSVCRAAGGLVTRKSRSTELVVLFIVASSAGGATSRSASFPASDCRLAPANGCRCARRSRSLADRRRPRAGRWLP